MSNKIIATYRKWLLEVTDHDAIATLADGSGERFECHRQPSAEDAMRAIKAKVDRLEGPEVWNLDYTDEELRQ